MAEPFPNPTEAAQLGSNGPLGFTGKLASSHTALQRCCSANVLTTYGPKPYTTPLQAQERTPLMPNPLPERLTFLDGNFAGMAMVIHDSGGISPEIRVYHRLHQDLWIEQAKHPSAEIEDKRTGFDPSQLPAEGYSRLGTLRRGGYGVV